MQARWLDAERAKHAYDFALQFGHKNRYGLNESTVSEIERHLIESQSVAKAWLKSRMLESGTVQIIYGDEEVCVIEAKDFIEKWNDIFMAARDDAIVLHNLNRTVLFYCHEEEFEIGQRNA
ncbi:hypothetical protein H8K35_08165 [Undibacterium sp. LX40W]|uniref:Uncharacterized protein n=1 Tax=Undibacterium nitidum TaxID=2762298 RepID=A0A923HM63_9BURK|nr:MULTISPECIES: hypothetical protein [Undibacterium]MBC3881592.1 hypothetical protein [Undibacterium nitidum]MBC3891626.1 hypothetical protein [Undibacterium sp. LX40W]